MSPHSKIIVTDHAAERWIQRQAEHLSESHQDVIAAFQESVKVHRDECLPFSRAPHTVYYKHPDGAYFVVDPSIDGLIRLVTIITPEVTQKPILVPKRRIKPRREVSPEEPAPKEVVKPEFKDIEEEYGWLVSRRQEVCVSMASYAGQGKHTLRYQRLKEESNELLSQIIALKPVYKAYKIDKFKRRNASEEIYREEIYREDGNLNYPGAINHLLKKVEEMQSQIDKLKKQIDGMGPL